jgi:hypothetical protein
MHTAPLAINTLIDRLLDAHGTTCHHRHKRLTGVAGTEGRGRGKATVRPA